MSAPEPPPRNVSDPPLPYEQAAARAAGAPGGGWTGFWTVTWAACVGLTAALLAAALVLGPSVLDVVDLVVAQFALEQGAPLGTLEDSTAELTAAAAMLVSHVRIWVWIVAALSAATIVTGLRLTAGSEWGRKWSRALLVLQIATAVAGSAYVRLTAVPALASQAGGLRTAIVELARNTGETVDSGMLDGLLDPAWMSAAAWAPTLLIGLPSALLWLAAGRASVRTWCTPHAASSAR